MKLKKRQLKLGYWATLFCCLALFFTNSKEAKAQWVPCPPAYILLPAFNGPTSNPGCPSIVFNTVCCFYLGDDGDGDGGDDGPTEQGPVS